MPFQRPTLNELIARTEQDLQARMTNQQSALLRRSVLAVIARVIAGASHLLHGFLEWASRQFFTDTADSEWLARRATLWGITRKAAAFASGGVDFTGTDGSTIPAGTTLKRSDGVEYETDADGTISGGTATIQVTADEAGDDGNASSGVTLQLATTLSGVDSEAAVGSNGITGGEDTESDDDLRARVRQRIQEVPHGGAEQDYERWALEVAQVTRAWPIPTNRGIGTIDVTFVLDDESPIIPGSTKVQEVQDYIDERRPVTADFLAFAPTAVPLAFTISVTPDTADVRAAVESELKDMLRRDSAPGGTILLSHIREAISVAAGETDHDLNSPTADVTHASGEIATFGGITWQ